MFCPVLHGTLLYTTMHVWGGRLENKEFCLRPPLFYFCTVNKHKKSRRQGCTVSSERQKHGNTAADSLTSSTGISLRARREMCAGPRLPSIMEVLFHD